MQRQIKAMGAIREQATYTDTLHSVHITCYDVSKGARIKPPSYRLGGDVPSFVPPRGPGPNPCHMMERQTLRRQL